MFKIIHLAKNTQIRQSLLLLTTSVLVMLFLLTTNHLLTKSLDRGAFGDYSLILNIFNFSQIAFNFGFFYSIGRMVTQTEIAFDHRRLFGSGLIIILFLFLIMAISLYFYAYLFQTLNNNSLKGFLICIPLSWVFLLNNFIECLLQSINKINLIAYIRIAPRIIFLSCIIGIYQLSIPTSVAHLLVIFIISSIIPYVYIVVVLKPSFFDVKSNIKEIYIVNKKFGFSVYFGSLVAVGASSLSGILISFLGVDNIEVGYYSIALQLSAPLTLIPNILATISFRGFANADSIDKKLQYITIMLSLFAMIVIFVVAKPLILKVYGDSYLESVNLLRIIGIGSILYGIADFYNKFLLSKGKGRELRNASFLVGGILLISNVVLISLFGARGAAISTVVAGSSYLIVIVYYFNQTSIRT